MESPHKIFILGTIVICIFYYASVVVPGARAQDFYNASITFENITFDMVSRGSYNISYCIESMLNCWEAVKPDIICLMNNNKKYYTTVCDLMRELCSEWSLDQDAFHSFAIKDTLCQYYEYWT